MEYKWIISFLFLIVVQCVLSAELHGLRSERASKKKGKDCNPWVFEECKAKKGNCGEGKKLGRRTGADCGKTEKVFPCTVPCDGESPSSNQGKNKRGGDKKCKYRKGVWSSCHPLTNMKNMTMTLKKGDPSKCPATKQKSKPCKKGKACKYTRGDWSSCDPVTNMKKRILTLRKGNPNTCEREKTLTKSCRSVCKYTRGDWSNCDATTNQKSRTLTLRKGDPNSCEKEKVITKSCKRACQYEKGEWSPCDASTKTKQRTLTLKDGSDASCPATKPQTRECKGGENKDRCFFGQWGEYSDCQNGVRKKQRELKFGGADCQKRAVKTKPC